MTWPSSVARETNNIQSKCYCKCYRIQILGTVSFTSLSLNIITASKSQPLVSIYFYWRGFLRFVCILTSTKSHHHSEYSTFDLLSHHSLNLSWYHYKNRLLTVVITKLTKILDMNLNIMQGSGLTGSDETWKTVKCSSMTMLYWTK